jgi:hypothetical protein
MAEGKGSSVRAHETVSRAGETPGFVLEFHGERRTLGSCRGVFAGGSVSAPFRRRTKRTRGLPI